ncbi:hypothetical protein ACHAW6_002395 [Cyclotella cf. meneghiniana]
MLLSLTKIWSQLLVAHSTQGCELCCTWKDGRTSGQKLSDLKESHFFRLLSLHLPQAFPMNEPSTVLSTTSRPTYLGLSLPKLWTRIM